MKKRRAQHRRLMDLPEFQRRLAARVRELRATHDLRQDDLEEFGLSWKAVQKVEYAKTDARASTLLKLAKAFGMPLTELLTFDIGKRRR